MIAGSKAVARAADARAADVAPVIAELQASAAESLRHCSGLERERLPSGLGVIRTLPASFISAENTDGPARRIIPHA